MSRTNKEFQEIDKSVGNLIRTRRKKIRVSQIALATVLEVSYQMVQKYETGQNRISAGKLFIISKTLKVPPCYFFQEFDHEEMEDCSCKK